MKRLIAVSVLSAIVGLSAGRAVAVPDDYDDTQSHPLRVAAYLISPVGYTLEWLVFRPFHYIVSQPVLDRVFGHRAHEEVGSYR